MTDHVLSLFQEKNAAFGVIVEDKKIVHCDNFWYVYQLAFRHLHATSFDVIWMQHSAVQWTAENEYLNRFYINWWQHDVTFLWTVVVCVIVSCSFCFFTHLNGQDWVQDIVLEKSK